MAISIDFIDISSNILQTNKLITVIRCKDQVANWALVRVAHCAGMAKLKINVAQEKFILEFAVILVTQCRDKK